MLPALIASAAAAQTPEAFAGIPGVTIDYYDVSGVDAASIRESINANRVVDPHDGTRVYALSNWYYGWSGRQNRSGKGCVVSAVTIDFTATVRLPRLVTPVGADVQAQWDRYANAIAEHEAGHVRYAYDHRRDVAAAIRRAGCASADRAAKAAIARIDAWQLTYDQTTHHGETQGAVID